MQARFLFSLGLVCLGGLLGYAKADGQCANSRYQNKPAVFVLTDISNEPDDQMSLVRFLTYTNEFDVKGIAAVTSYFLNDTTDEPTIREVIGAYGQVIQNLNANVPADYPYPSTQELLSKVTSAKPVYGLAALGPELSSAAAALISAGDSATPEKPLWVAIWAGAAVLAEALNYVSETRDSNAVACFVDKLRVYSISDQDDAGAWIRLYYPNLFYIVSLHGFLLFGESTWTGISGEVLRHFDVGGPDTSLVTNDWLQTHIRIGPLGAKYLNFTYIMEGDTPSFLPLIQNGLGDLANPDWGSWGGRYLNLDQTHRVNVFANTEDYAVGVSGNGYVSTYATIWRWRQAYQFDFAARMAWSVEGSYTKNNHAPIPVVNDTCGPDALQITYQPGQSLYFDASKSWDPDGDTLAFNWFYYRDITENLEGPIPAVSPLLDIETTNPSGSSVKLTPNKNSTFHVILMLNDTREMALTTYRRIILNPAE